MTNEFILHEFGKRVRHLRTQKKLSQEQLSFLTGFHRTYIGMIERGERNISLTNIIVFSKAFELTLDELFKFDRPKELYKNYRLKKKD